MEGGRGGYGKDDDEDGRIIRWEDTVEKFILGTEPNDTLSYALGLELHHPIMSMLGGHGGQLEIYIYKSYILTKYRTRKSFIRS